MVSHNGLFLFKILNKTTKIFPVFCLKLLDQKKFVNLKYLKLIENIGKFRKIEHLINKLTIKNLHKLV